MDFFDYQNLSKLTGTIPDHPVNFHIICKLSIDSIAASQLLKVVEKLWLVGHKFANLGREFWTFRALPQIWVIVTDQSEFFPQLWAIRSENYLELFNFEALFQRVVGHLSEKLLQWSNIHIQGRANLPFPVRLKPQKWLYLANTFILFGQYGINLEPIMGYLTNRFVNAL